jgi:hypothetical protein
MTDRNRRLLIGFGLMFGLQFIVAWVARTWLGIVGSVNNIVGILLIFTIAIYFGGGLVMGLLSERSKWLELLAVSTGAVILNVILYIAGVVADLTFISAAFSSRSPVLFMLANFSGVIFSASIGYVIGVRIQRQPNELEEVSISPERRKALSLQR